jgi:hypothetical protein
MTSNEPQIKDLLSPINNIFQRPKPAFPDRVKEFVKKEPVQSKIRSIHTRKQSSSQKELQSHTQVSPLGAFPQPAESAVAGPSRMKKLPVTQQRQVFRHTKQSIHKSGQNGNTISSKETAQKGEPKRTDEQTARNDLPPPKTEIRLEQ